LTDVFAILPTGFGENLICSVAKSVTDAVAPAVIVVVLLQSIAEEEVRINDFDFKAVQLSPYKEKL